MQLLGRDELTDKQWSALCVAPQLTTADLQSAGSPALKITSR